MNFQKIFVVENNPFCYIPVETLFFCACLSMLTACGGGGSGGTSAVRPPPPPTSIIEQFSDGFGIVQIDTSTGGTEVRGKITDEVVEVADSAAQAELFRLANEDIVGYTNGNITLRPALRAVASTSRVTGGNLYEFSTVVNGQSVDTLIFIDDDESVGILYGAIDGQAGLYTFGEQVSAIPTGQHTYRGFNAIGRRQESVTSAELDGSFSMNVNFDQASVTSLSARTTTSSVTGTNIPINMNQGTFTGAISLDGAYVGGSALEGTVYGDFHGAGASEVSGVYHEDATNPAYIGVFAGSR
ncbi:MAG: transferrin-binding protein-like solute binding protein [Gammaproteobacteria bacterium]